MFLRPSAAQAETQEKASFFGRFVRAKTESVLDPERAETVGGEDDTDESRFGGFENFGRTGLDLGGLHRDQQWVGAWGGRC